MKRAHIFLLFTWICFQLQGQDIHFSQFVENPALVNPALTGAKNPVRASLSFREQSRGITTPYRTFGMSFETRFTQSEWTQVDSHRSMTFKEKSISRLAAGLSVYSDKSGDGGLGTTLSSLSLAYFVPLNSSNFVSLGVQGSIVQKKIDNSKLLFPNQYDGKGYDPYINSREKYTTLYYVYQDLAAGLLWSYKHSQKRINSTAQSRANLGFSAYHLTEPKQQFLQNGKALKMKYAVHGEFLFFPFSNDVAINPSFLIQQQGALHETTAGALVKYYNSFTSKYTGLLRRSSLGLGAYFRSSGSLIMAMTAEKNEQYSIGLNYDLNLRAVSAAAGMGGLELTLRFTPPNAFLYQKKTSNRSDR